jgi:lambda family phage portal protein
MAEESKLNFLDRAIAIVSPESAMRRVTARYWLNEFETGEWRDRGGSGGKTKNAAPESQRKQRDRIKGIWDARDMEEKFCLVRGILDRLEQYVCGDITYQSRTGDSEIDEAYQNYFHDWCGRADITGRFRFREMVGQGFRAMVRDGEYGWIMLMHGGEYRLQGIEADRIGGPDNPKAAENNIGGIKINELGQVTGYEIYKRTRMAQYKKDIEATPDKFIHLFKALRSDQYHGESWFGPALPHARDIHELYRFEKMAMKFAAAFAGFIRRTNPMGASGGTKWATQKGGKNGSNSFPVEAGMLKVLQEGEDIIFPTSTGRPSSSLIQFVEILIREIALGLNLPYGFVYNMAQLGGVTARIELMQVVRAIRRFQKILEDIVLNRVKDEVLNLGIAMGHIPPHPKWNQGKWSFGARLTGDSGNYVQETMILLANGLISPSDIIEEMTGGAHAEVTRKIVADLNEAQEIAALGKKPLELVSPARYGNATQLLAAMNTPPSDPPPPKGMVEKQGEKAVGLLLDIMDKYAAGTMEREQAITALVHSFGVRRARAEAMIPERRPEPNGTNRTDRTDRTNEGDKGPGNV